MFAAKVAIGVRTNEIDGMFTPLEALEIMLADTPLQIVEDRETGAFAVIRVSEEFVTTPAPDPLSTKLELEPRTNPEMNDNKTIFSGLMKGLLAIVISSGPELSAQQSSIQGDDEIYDLSPFSVQSTEAGGYQVTDTLAGSRLRADVEDIGAAITLISKDYMEDLAITNIMDLASFLPSTEPVSTHINPNGGADVFRGNRVNIRGLFSESIARNYFSAPIGEYMPPMDGFNADRITLSAGANSILFGSANPSGIINTQVAPAILYKDTNRLLNRMDNYGSQRFEYATNKVLIEDKLAVRLHLLHEEREMFRDPQYLDQQRVYGAVVFKPFENTTINANVEYTDWERNTAVPTTSVSRISAWNNYGDPTTFTDGTTNPSSIPGITRATGGNQTRIIFGSASSIDPVQNWKNYAVSDWFRAGVTNHSNFPVPFDFMDHDQNMGNHRLDDRYFWIGDISLEQKFTDKFYMQFAFFTNNHQKDIRWTGGNQIWADASTTLPDGSPNPNVGDYFFGGNTVENRDFLYENRNFRWTTTYDLDLTEFNKWAGRHMLSLMYQDNTGRRFTDRQRLVNNTPLPGYNSNILNNENRIRPVFYVDLDGGDRAPADSLDLRNFDTQFSELPGINAEYVNFRSGIDTETIQEVYMLAGQSFFFDDHLVTTAGYRIDTQDVSDVAAPDWARKSDGTWVSYHDGINERTLNEAVSNVEEDTYSYGAVYHLVKNKDWVDNFSLSYNRSNNFEPSVADPNFQGVPRDFSTGQTIDYGLRGSFFGGKLTAKISRFESSQSNARASDHGFVRSGFDAIWSALADEIDPSFIDRQFNATVTDTFDIVAEGLEMGATYLPTENWRFALFASQNEAVRSNIIPSALRYLNDNRAEVLQYEDIEVPDRSNMTVSEVVQDMDNDMDFVQAQDGRLQPEMREWKFSLLTNYAFTEGSLRGVSVGGYVNWQDKSTIGYAFDDSGKVNVDHPFEGAELFDTGFHIGYKTRIYKDRIHWKIQLNIRNLLNDTTPTPVRADEDAYNNDVQQNWAYRIVEPRSVLLTNTFSW